MRWLRSCALLVGLLLIGYGQAVALPDENELIHSLMLRIEQLEKRLELLEGGKPVASVAVPVAPPSVVADTPIGVLASPHEHDVPPVPAGQDTYPLFKLSGFSDINFSATDQHGSHSGFNEGQFVLHIISALSPRVTYFGELSVSARTDPGTGTPPAPGFNFEVERSIIRFDQSDYLKVSFGRYHTPINYWNTAFHHGSWLQTTESRPEMTQFGGSFIPVHFVGALVEGGVPAGGVHLNYDVGIGNGRSSVISRSGDFGAVNNNRAWLVNLYAKPDHPYGLQFGASLYRDRVPQSATPDYREWIESAHVVWQRENPEIIAEFANVNHRRIGSSAASNSQAWYVQTGYRLPWFERGWKPYYRYEYIHVPKADVVFRAVPSLSGSTLGLRYDISNFAALKFEYRHLRRPGLVFIDGVFVQTSFTF
jgi:hypothetical protein